MPLTGNNIYSIIRNMIYKAVFFIDPTAEFTLEIAFQSFRITDSLKHAIPFYALDQHIDTFQSFFILRLPVQIIIPCII